MVAGRDKLSVDAGASPNHNPAIAMTVGADGRFERSAGLREGGGLIRHIVFFSARDRNDVERVRAGLMDLARIPHSRFFEVALNSKVDPLSDEIDVVVYAEFSDQAALAAYKAHPLYAETTAKVRPLRELRFSADFASGE